MALEAYVAIGYIFFLTVLFWRKSDLHELLDGVPVSNDELDGALVCRFPQSREGSSISQSLIQLPTRIRACNEVHVFIVFLRFDRQLTTILPDAKKMNHK